MAIPSNQVTSQKPGKLKYLYLLIFLIPLYFFLQYEGIKKDGDIFAKYEVKVLTQKVGKHIELPIDETPTIGTVTDPKKLGQTEFFKKAEKGDKIMIYSKSGVLIIYRPKKDKLIDAAKIEKKNKE